MRGWASVFAAAVLSLSSLTGGARAGPRLAAENALARGLLSEINAVRALRGLRPLRVSPRLTAAANHHSRQMARLGFFSHSSRSGLAFRARVQRYYGSRRYAFWSVGENLLYCSPGGDPHSALRRWMGSPAHRRNLLTARWREIGLSAIRVDSAGGAFRGQDVTIVTADFGVRRPFASLGGRSWGRG